MPQTMITTEELATRYVAMWHETDAAVRRETIEDLWAPDGANYLKSAAYQGHAAIEARVAASHDKNVIQGKNRFRARPGLQVVQNGMLLTWEMLPQGSDTVLAVGLEFFVLNDEGRILSDHQFIIS
ncbi:hypothetical protein [Mesorhizobium sp. INR15]|uniref:hypothetical protein n=1 Tax=Mesorhizobium sp. INR15 TaxID=2654248 RepID=UPI0018969EAC|nr:hypothetical protein [Mesorhizobium sp. INR15]QPC92279.1 hypothetical protein GA829_17790 [Mesorhizobium sp. INR15]